MNPAPRIPVTTTASLAALALLAALTASCGSTITTSVPATAAGCHTGAAQISLGDGFQRLLCGCQEPSGTVIGSGKGSLTCTVAVGTTVLVIYEATLNNHQFLSTSGKHFISSPISGGLGVSRTYVHSVKLDEAGTYGYKDAFDGGIVGQLIAQ